MRRQTIFAFLIIFSAILNLFVFGHSVYSSQFSRVSSDFVNEYSSQEIFSLALDSADALLKNAVLFNDQVKWPRIVGSPPENLPESDSWPHYYYGYWWGAGGIGDVLLSFYSNSGNETYLTYAEKTAQYILNAAENKSTGAIFWNISEHLPSKYIGQKYGNVGIATFLIHLYEITKNDTYSDMLKATLQTLVNGAINELDTEYWGITIGDSLGTTDLIYGAAGVVSVFLEASIILNDSSQKWLNHAIKGARWIKQVSKYSSSDTYDMMFSPWSPDFNAEFTGLGSGNAGIGSVFLKLFQVTGNTTWLSDAQHIGNWLLHQQTNGTWIEGGIGYTTELDGRFAMTGMDGGATGIITYLLDLYQETRINRFMEGAKEALDWLLVQKLTSEKGYKWPKVIKGIDQFVYLTGWGYGAAGIGDVFSRAFEMFGCPHYRDAMAGAIEWLKSQQTDLGLYPVAVGDTRLTQYLSQYGSHLSFSDGSAGIIFFLLRAVDRYNASTLFPSFISCDPLSTTESPLFDIGLAALAMIIPATMIFLVFFFQKRKIK